MSVTFKGTSLPFYHVEVGATAEARKVISYPGVNGTYEMIMGTRRQRITIRGFLNDVSSQQAGVRALENEVGTLTCSIQGTFTNVKCTSVVFNNYRNDCVTGNNTCEYAMTFEKLL